jgi:hypothetical protein
MIVAFTDYNFNPFKCNIEDILYPYKNSMFYFCNSNEILDQTIYEVKKIECRKNEYIENNFIYIIEFIDLNDFLSFCFRSNKAAIQRYLRPIYDINDNIIPLDAFMYFIPDSFTYKIFLQDLIKRI